MRLFCRNERGVVLLTVTILIATFAVLGTAFLLSSVGNSRLTAQQVQLTRASYIAAAGVDLAIYDLAYNGKVFGDTWDQRDYGGGDLRVNTLAQLDSQGQIVSQRGIIVAQGRFPTSALPWDDPTYRGVTTTIETSVQNDTAQVHELFFKAIYSGNRWADPNNHIDLTGVNHHQHDYMDNIAGDIHIEGEIRLGGDASANHFPGKMTATGDIVKYDMIDRFKVQLGGGSDDSITPPDLASQGYDRAAREYRSYDPNFQGTGRDVVNVGNEYAHYQSLNQVQTIRISCEDSSAWHSSAQALPDSAAGNFFQKDYQFHYTKTFTSSDDAKMEATGNYYLGARNGGTSGSYGNNKGGGLYGGGHSVITINPEQNNKVFFLDGNLWIDSDGSNHVFFVPGPGVDRINITIVAKGNIYIGDQVFVTTNQVNTDQYSRNIGGYTSDPCFRMTDPDSGIALVAMRDGESYNDTNKNGKYDVGETIIGREDPGTPVPAANNPTSGSYRGRWEGSGNIVFGDTINGPIGVVEAFMFAENNFVDISSDTSTPDQNPYIFGNMTAGNEILLNRYYTNWLNNGTSWKINDGLPPTWVYTKSETGPDGVSRTYYYPPGTTDANRTNPLVTTMRMYKSGNNWLVELRQHVPTDLTYDDRIEEGVITLPGLPSSNKTLLGCWKIVVWKQYTGRK